MNVWFQPEMKVFDFITMMFVAQTRFAQYTKNKHKNRDILQGGFTDIFPL